MARKLPVIITEKEFKEIIKELIRRGNKAKNEKKKLRYNKLKLAFMLGFYQCMRVSEVIKLKPEHIDERNGWIHILQAKGKKDRDIPIMPPVRAGLKYLPIPYSIRTLQREIKKVCKSVLNKDIHFHSLRGGGASFYLNEKKRDIRHIQEFLGHANISTTQIYTFVTPTNLKESFEEAWK
jgi:integrase